MMARDSDDRNLLVLLLVALGVLVFFPAMFMGVGMMGAGGMMGGHMWDGGAWGWFPLLGLAMPLLFLLVLLGGAYLLFRAVAGGDDHDPAMEELRAAYARGELTDEEYENRRERLEDDRTG